MTNEELLHSVRNDEVYRGAFKTFAGQSGYMAQRAGDSARSILTKEFLSNSVIRGGFKGAALGITAGIMTTAVDRWTNPVGRIDNGVINGTTSMMQGAAIGALGGFAASATLGALRNLKGNFSSNIAKEVFNAGKEGGIGAKVMSFAGRRLGGSITMGAAALGASAYIGGKVLKSIISTNLTRPADGGQSSPSPLVHRI